MTKQPERAPRPRAAWMTVAGRDISLKVRDTSFAISILVTIVSIVGAVLASTVLGGKDDTAVVAVTADSAVQIVDRAAEHADGEPTLSTTPHDDIGSVIAAVKDEDADLGLAFEADGTPQLIGRTATDSEAAGFIQQAHGELTVEGALAEAGVDPEQLRADGTLTNRVLVDQETSGGAVRVTGIILAIAFYLLALMFGALVAQSVLEEKQNRIAEIVAALIPLRSLLLGKLIASTVVALIQVAVLAIATVTVLRVVGTPVAMPQLGASAAWFVAYFVAGYLAVAALWAVAGALATRQEDLQHTATPVSMLLIIVIPVGIFLSGTWLTIASYVPIASVVAMPTRVIAGDTQWWEPIVSLTLLTLFALVVVRFAASIYRRSLMQTRQRLTIRQAMKVSQ